jgi:hypothetical protein
MRHEPCPVGRRAGHEPVDHLAYILAADHALVDQQLFESSRPRGRRWLVTVRDRRMRVIVVVATHSGSSNQCS